LYFTGPNPNFQIGLVFGGKVSLLIKDMARFILTAIKTGSARLLLLHTA